jgi:hypothetical protein
VVHEQLPVLARRAPKKHHQRILKVIKIDQIILDEPIIWRALEHEDPQNCKYEIDQKQLGEHIH